MVAARERPFRAVLRARARQTVKKAPPSSKKFDGDYPENDTFKLKCDEGHISSLGNYQA